jgi:cell division transport system permease protein
MRTIQYAFREGWMSLWRSRGSATFAVLAIALAMLVLGALLLLTSNVERLIGRWTTAAEFSVYLRDDATSEQRGAIEAAIDQSGVAARREYVSKAQALVRFRKEFADLAPLADGFDDNPFPASLEVQVRPEAERDGRANTAVTRLLRLPGVADVRYDREWLSRLAGGLAALRGAGLALVVLMALAAAVTVASVVRLGLHSRRDELEIMQLVGSPISFIRGPFVAEGVMQGGVGAALALGLLWIGFAVTNAWWGGELTAMLDGASVSFLPPALSAMVVAGGMVVGAIGGFAASRHAV